jgi:hypothetical protein
MSALVNNNIAPIMSTTRHMALSLALLAALAVATAARGAATTPSSDAVVTTLSSLSDDGRPPTTGPTNPTGFTEQV